MTESRNDGKRRVGVPVRMMMTEEHHEAWKRGEIYFDHGLRDSKGRLVEQVDAEPLDGDERPESSSVEPVSEFELVEDDAEESESSSSSGLLLGAVVGVAAVGLGVAAFKAWKGRRQRDDTDEDEVIEAEPVDDDPATDPASDVPARKPRVASSTPRLEAPPVQPVDASQFATRAERLRQAKAMRDALDEHINREEWELRHAQIQPDRPKQVKPTPPPLPPSDHRLITPADTTFKSILGRLGWRRNHPADR